MKKLAVGVLGAALLLTIGTTATLNAGTVTVQSGEVSQSAVQQGTAPSADRLYLNRNNTCNYAGTFHNYYNCTGDCRNYVDEDQDGVCDNYEAGGYRSQKNQNAQSTQQNTENGQQSNQSTQDTQNVKNTQSTSSAQYTYGRHHGENGGQNGYGRGCGQHGGCRR